MSFALSNERLDVDRKKSDFLEQCPDRNSAGGFAYFEGRVRDLNDGRAVKALEYEAYDELAQTEGNEIVSEAIAKFDLIDAYCVHRVGYLELGEIAVWIAAAAPHRSEAFAACQYIIDEVKKRVPLWKKEHYVDSEPEWVNCQHHSSDCKPHTDAKDITESQFYSRQFVLPSFGILGQNKLRASKVLVIGAGGLGSPALLYLAGAGCGRVDVCDFDNVEPSNLHRQILYSTENLAAQKATVASERARLQNPFISSRALPLPIDAEIAKELFGQYDVILDCTDNLETKLLVSDCAIAANVTLFSASVRQFEGQLHGWIPAQDSSNKYGGQCLRCLWHDKDVTTAQTCADSGILGAVTGVLGSMQALEAIKYLVGMPSPLVSRVCLMDLLSLEITQIAVTHNEKCPTCKFEISKRSSHVEDKSHEHIGR
jgi:sulfur-carrier protein adenylyltransferase/sulfurtransferase